MKTVALNAHSGQQNNLLSSAIDELSEVEVATKQQGGIAQADDEVEISWSDYPRVEPGEYRGYVRVAKTYFDVRYKRWTCLLRFDLLSNDCQRVLAERIPCWLSLGYGNKPHASSKGSYFAAWLDANGGHKPRRTDRLSPRIFLRRMCRVCHRRHHERTATTRKSITKLKREDREE